MDDDNPIVIVGYDIIDSTQNEVSELKSIIKELLTLRENSLRGISTFNELDLIKRANAIIKN